MQKKPGLKTILSLVKPKIKCIHCGGECPPTDTAYSNWCDECFLNPPLGHRFREATPEDIAQMLNYQEKSKASLAAKKANKKAFATTSDTISQQKGTGKKRTITVDNNNLNSDDDLIFNCQA
ncbi:hypothetical protein [Microcoleus sp. MON2_D5]|uniref:hypothetical protein n=1 Tax=Microcoleus sp. MON2_D5 TaxID=2818833 RepID=UPI002FD77005